MIERDPWAYVAVLAAMGIAVALCRVGGFWLLGRFTMGKRLRKALDALPGAVIAATVAPILLTGGTSGLLSVATAALTMLVVRNDFAALAAGVAVAAGVRAVGF